MGLTDGELTAVCRPRARVAAVAAEAGMCSAARAILKALWNPLVTRPRVRTDGGFGSREHIFSEALGNEEYVFEPGVVCDRCNNGPLALGDGELVNFAPIALLRAERGLATKDKHPVAAQFSNARIYYTERGAMTVETNSPKTTARMQGNTGEMDLIGNRLTERRARLMCRAVWKSALELFYWDNGPAAFDPIFDGARAAILDGRAHGWCVVPKYGTPTEVTTLEYSRLQVGGREAMPVVMSVFGVEFHTDLLRRDLPAAQLTPPWEFNLWEF
jgi:hypothetical protein